MAPPTGTASAFSRCHQAGNESLVGEAPAHARPWATSGGHYAPSGRSSPRPWTRPGYPFQAAGSSPRRSPQRSFFNRYAL